GCAPGDALRRYHEHDRQVEDFCDGSRAAGIVQRLGPLVQPANPFDKRNIGTPAPEREYVADLAVSECKIVKVPAGPARNRGKVRGVDIVHPDLEGLDSPPFFQESGKRERDARLPAAGPVAGDEQRFHARLLITAPNSLSTISRTPSVFGCRSISTSTCWCPIAWSGATWRGPFVTEKHSIPFVYSGGIACGTPAMSANDGAISRMRVPSASPFAPYSSSAPTSSSGTPRIAIPSRIRCASARTLGRPRLSRFAIYVISASGQAS